MIKNRPKHLTRKIDFKANSETIMDIPRDNLCRRISMFFNIKVTTPAGDTPATGIKNESIFNLIKRIRVKVDGSTTIFDVDLPTYFYLLEFEYGCKINYDSFAIPAAGATSTFQIPIPIDFATIRNAISDYSALIPAPRTDSFELLVDWGDISDVVTTVNDTVIDAATDCEVSIIEVYETTTDTTELENIYKNLVLIKEGVEETVINRAHSSYPADELPVQIRPVPARHLAHMFFAKSNITDLNPDFDNAVITWVKLENVKGGGEQMFLEKFNILNKEQEREYRMDTSASRKGMVYFDLVDMRNGGLLNNNVDALKYKFLTAAPTAGKVNAIRIYKKYITTRAD